MTVKWTDKWADSSALAKYLNVPALEETKAFSKEQIAAIYGSIIPDGPLEYGKDWTTPGGTFEVYAAPGGTIEPAPVPEHLCPNCRRDWHEVPLSEVVAGMCDGLSFDENYDPDTDDSRVVCPGSECYGPAVNFKGASSTSWFTAPTGAIIYSYYSPTPAPWVTYGDSAWNEVGPSPWPPVGFAEEEKSPWTFGDASAESVLLDELKEDFPSVTVSTWFPDETVEQAALDAAPKAIEMTHKPPVSCGLDFSGFKFDGPTYVKLTTKGKKK